MPLSTRFPAAVHILTLLSAKAVKEECFASSELIAKSVGTNAVVVRRLLSLLQSRGFIVTQTGTQGGTKLNVDPEKLTLLDIYEAVEEVSIFKMHEPHPECPVAVVVKQDVEKLLHQAEDKMKAELANIKLSQLTKAVVAEVMKRK